jgi:hypothetical protein
MAQPKPIPRMRAPANAGDREHHIGQLNLSNAMLRRPVTADLEENHEPGRRYPNMPARRMRLENQTGHDLISEFVVLLALWLLGLCSLLSYVL